jgi:hypothetical protein
MTRFPKTRLHGTPFTEASRSPSGPPANTVKFITFIGLRLRTVLGVLQRNSRASGESWDEFCRGYEKWPHQPLSMAGAAWK